MTAVTVTNAGLNLLRDAQVGALTGTLVDARIYYVAVGTSSTSPTASDTQLGAEVFRKAMTSYADGASAGEGIFTLYLSPADAVGVAIAEVGWFAGSGAGPGANTGVMVARVLYSHTKLNTESIQMTLDSTL